MALTITSPITGAAMTGFTAPTHTHVSGTAPQYNGNQRLITSLGGTQTGAQVNSTTVPFRLNFVTPQVIKGPAPLNSVTNKLAGNNRNKWLFLGQKGGLLLPSSYVYDQLNARLELDVPAGLETASPGEIKSFLSAFIGALWGNSASLADTIIAGG